MPGMEMPAGESMPGMEMPGAAAPAAGAMAGMDHGSMKMRDFSVAPQVDKNPGVQTISPMPSDRMGEPGQGLENAGHKVLTYHDLVGLERNTDRSEEHTSALQALMRKSYAAVGLKKQTESRQKI